jgi:phosphoserine phosphatase RsbU/P
VKVKSGIAPGLSELLDEKLSFKQQQINSILEITQAINSNASARVLLQSYEEILIKAGLTKRVAVFTSRVRWQCMHISGVDENLLEDFDARELFKYHEIGKLSKSKHPFVQEFNIIIPVYHKLEPLSFTLLGGWQPDLSSPDDTDILNFIQILSNIVSIAIENKFLFRAQNKQRVMREELELAGEVQTMMIPVKVPENVFLEAAAEYIPHLGVGGDYYDFLQLNEEEYLVCIADISGHGVAAALLMANFQASMRALCRQNLTLEEIVEKLNESVNAITKGEKFITLFLARINFYLKRFWYVNAGHTASIFLHGDEVRLLESTTTMLGIFEKLPSIRAKEERLSSGDLLFCLTDGVPDIENKGKEALGISRIREFVITNRSLVPKELNKKLMDQIRSFAGSSSFRDDLCFVTCRFK